MIRSSALLIAVAMGLLVAGVFASSLELVYVSIGVSILAAACCLSGWSSGAGRSSARPGRRGKT